MNYPLKALVALKGKRGLNFLAKERRGGGSESIKVIFNDPFYIEETTRV